MLKPSHGGMAGLGSVDAPYDIRNMSASIDDVQV